MEKFCKWCSVTLAGVLLSFGIVGTLVVPVMATGDEGVMPLTTPETPKEIEPTFTSKIDDSTDTAELWIGKNLMLAGNNVASDIKAQAGLMLIAGNNLTLQSESEYGFLAGNIVNFTGKTDRDLFIAANIVTLGKGARVGRNAFIASSSLRVETDLPGDLAYTGDTLELSDVTIAGNLDLSVNRVKFGNNVKIGGSLNYNETATVSGIENVTYGNLNVYEVPTLDARAALVAEIYLKFVSIAGLFIVFSLICALYPRVHGKIASETTVNRFGIDLAVGIGVLIVVPVLSLLAFLTFVAAPLGIIALALYMIMLYVAQGFTGAWLGHLLIEKAFKSKTSNIFIEALLGIVILGILALIPYIGVVTGFLSLLLGLGLIVNCIKPAASPKAVTKAKTTA